MPDISKINLNGTTYNIKDANALTETDADSKYVEKVRYNNGVYAQQDASTTSTISLDQPFASAMQIVTKDHDYQIEKPSYSGGPDRLSNTNILNKQEINGLITSKNYATQAYVQEQLATITKFIYIVNGLNRTGYYVSNELISTRDLLYSEDIELNSLIQSDLYTYIFSATSMVNYKFVYIYETLDQTITCYNYFIEERHVANQFAIYFNYVYTGSAYVDFTAQTAIIAAENGNSGNAEIQIKEQTFI